MNSEAAGALTRAAEDYEEIAQDLERGALEIRHPELMPQNDHPVKEDYRPGGILNRSPRSDS